MFKKTSGLFLAGLVGALAIFAFTAPGLNSLAPALKNSSSSLTQLMSPGEFVNHLNKQMSKQFIPGNGEYKYHSVTVYYADWCGSCHALMASLDKLGVKYKKVNVETSGKSFPYIPVMVVDGKSYVGNQSTSALKKILGI